MIDTLIKWFNDVFKSKFLELNEIQKQIFTKKNSLLKQVAVFVDLNCPQAQKQAMKKHKT